MEVLHRFWKNLRPFFFGCVFGVLLVYGALLADRLGVINSIAEVVYAATGTIRPNGDGGTNGGTATSCGGGGNYDCLDDVVTAPTAPNTGSDYLVQASNDVDFFQMDNSITDALTVTSITMHVYHQEGGTNMTLDGSLWNAAQSTQYGTTQNFSNQTTAGWDSVTFSGLSLTQADLTGLRTRLQCTKGGGKGSDCTSYAMYLVVTYDQAIDVTVAANGTQQNADIDTANNYLGGMFYMTENTGSRDITSITIEETGTVDADADLSNVRLYYENASDCTVQSYGGGESQYGSATTFNASDQATFTDTGIGVTTASELCIYVVLDVDDTAGIGDTVEIQITDPENDVVGSGSAVVEPATVVAISGTTNLEMADLTQSHYHWRDDNGNESNTGADSLTNGNEDTTFDSASAATTYRLRIQVDNDGNKTSAATQYRLEYGLKVSTCDAIGSWIDVAGAGGDWDMSASQLVEGNNTTNITTAGKGAMIDPGGSTFLTTNGGQRESTSQTGNLTLTSTQFVELEYAIEAAGTVSEGATYCFRVSDAGTALHTYDFYPEATISSDLLVEANGSQTSTVTIPTTNFYNGGQFAVTDSTAASTHNITSVTITASGTVDLVNDIDNIKLFYEYDTSDPYNCASESYGGGESQYGSTDTNGFDASGTSTFSTGAAITASTTQGVCFYVVYDVLSSATDGELIEVRMTDPTTDITLNSGSLSPASLIDFTGTTELQAPYLEQLHYHWRNNDGTETTAGSQTNGTEDTAFVELPDSTVQRLRFGVANTGGATSGNKQYQLEWAQKVSTCEDVVSWTDIDDAADDWSVIASQLVDNANTSNISNSAGGVTNVGTFYAANTGQQDVNGVTNNINLPAGNWLELEYSIQAAGTVSEGASYCFRLTDNGTELDNYDVYAEASIKLDTDFAVTRGTSTITGTTVTITEGVDYDLQLNDATRAFVRITNAHHTGGGPLAGATGNHNANTITAYISNPGNITSNITFTRGIATNDTVIAWEVVEYIGDVGGENEIVVRSASTATYGTGNTTLTTGTISGIVDDNDVVPFITGQYNPDGGRRDYNTGLSTSAWNSGADTITFTRGETGADAVIVSYAAIEFTGANWSIQRAENTYTNAGVIETQPITSVNSLTRAFIHAQHRAGSGEDQHGDYGHEVWLSSIGNVSFRLNGVAQTPASHVSVAWVIENTQSTGDRMVVQRKNGSIPAGGGGLTVTNVTIDTEVDDYSVTSLFVNTSNSDANLSFPEPMVTARMISTTQFQMRVSDDAGANLYRAEIVEWPTAARKLVQNYYRLYVDNDAITPTDPWPAGVDDLAENAEMTANDGPIASGDSIRIRMTLNVTADTMPGGVDSFLLEYGERDTTCGAISEWYQLGDIGSTTALWRANDATPVDGTVLPSALITSVTDVLATYEEEEPTALSPNTAFVGEDIEFDWNIEDNGAADKTDYCFRMTEADGTPLESYTNYPVIRTVGYGPEVGDWKWFDDETNNTPTSDLAATNTAPIDIAFENAIKLRTIITEKSGAAGNPAKFKLQYSEYSDFSQGVFDVASSTICTASSTWCYYDGAGVDNATITANVLGGITGSCSGGVGAGCGIHNESISSSTATLIQPAYSSQEFEFTIQHQGARANAVYYFRLFNVVDNEVVAASSSYPSLVTEGASLVSTVAGLVPGQSTEGIVTNGTSSATAIEFGSVPPNTEYHVAHRVSVDTNATEGYQILMYADQPLTNTYGETIPAFPGTNASPLGWSANCSANCFGYHAGDDLLENGSTRFGANDTYAAVTTSPEEVAYSSVPVNESHDIIYKIQVDESQPAGDYTASITYLNIPAF